MRKWRSRNHGCLKARKLFEHLIISCRHTFPTFPHVVPSLSYMTAAAPTLTHHTLTHSAPDPSPLTPHAAKTVVGRTGRRRRRRRKLKKREKGGFGGRRGREGGKREAPRQAQSHCMRQARREKPFLCRRTHARDILAGGHGVVLTFVSGKTKTYLIASGLIMSKNEPEFNV